MMNDARSEVTADRTELKIEVLMHFTVRWSWWSLLPAAPGHDERRALL